MLKFVLKNVHVSTVLSDGTITKAHANEVRRMKRVVHRIAQKIYIFLYFPCFQVLRPIFHWCIYRISISVFLLLLRGTHEIAHDAPNTPHSLCTIFHAE